VTSSADENILGSRRVFDGKWVGVADLLEKVNDGRYEVIYLKLARSDSTSATRPRNSVGIFEAEVLGTSVETYASPAANDVVFFAARK